MTSRLLALPRELRDKVYELVLSAPREITIGSGKEQHQGDGPATSILRVNKQINIEASRVLYFGITLILEARWQMYLQTPCKPPLQMPNPSSGPCRRRLTSTSVLAPPPLPLAEFSYYWEPGCQIAGRILRKIARIEYCLGYCVVHGRKAVPSEYSYAGCTPIEATRFIMGLCAEDEENEQPVQKSFTFHICKLGAEMAEEVTRETVISTLEEGAVIEALKELLHYRDLVITASAHFSEEMLQQIMGKINERRVGGVSGFLLALKPGGRKHDAL